MKNLSTAPITPAKIPAQGPNNKPAAIGAASLQFTAAPKRLKLPNSVAKAAANPNNIP